MLSNAPSTHRHCPSPSNIVFTHLPWYWNGQSADFDVKTPRPSITPFLNSPTHSSPDGHVIFPSPAGRSFLIGPSYLVCDSGASAGSNHHHTKACTHHEKQAPKTSRIYDCPKASEAFGTEKPKKFRGVRFDLATPLPLGWWRAGLVVVVAVARRLSCIGRFHDFQSLWQTRAECMLFRNGKVNAKLFDCF